MGLGMKWDHPGLHGPPTHRTPSRPFRRTRDTGQVLSTLDGTGTGAVCSPRFHTHGGYGPLSSCARPWCLVGDQLFFQPDVRTHAMFRVMNIVIMLPAVSMPTDFYMQTF